ncbi:MAG: PP2C family protein-serine/threonine phosphatase [Phycisphaeraceae bacterium]|nr:PP2C family protein-serine/threonine phosphatase [Phycisphaeraceae bacterium]MCW5754571.1 PP2C family protein-serine/threonine phosphatase [Phycisphaeraceae bacterium]
MKFIDLHNHPQVHATAELQRELSRARTADESVQSFIRRIGNITPVRYMINVRTRGLEPGHFRLIERGTLEGRAQARTDLWSLRAQRPDHNEYPVRQGGIISSLVVEPGPKVIHDLKIHDDPVLGDAIAEFGSALATPIFEDGEVSEWVFSFYQGRDEAQPDHLRLSIPNANLLARTARQLDLIYQINDLNTRLRRQLQEVATVQQSLLPRRLPEIPGLKIATSYLTSDEAGGDYYDFMHLPDGRWAILIADVSGHGPAAATVMAMLHAILHGYERPKLEPAAIVQYANERLTDAALESTFVTAFLAIYDPVTANMAYTRAGHNPPRIKSGLSGAISTIEDAAGPPLGIVPTWEFETGRITINLNDTLVLYTDGITEAFNIDREMFGAKGLDDALEKCTGDPDCVVDSVHTALFEHTRSRRRADDQTIVAMRYVGHSTDARGQNPS